MGSPTASRIGQSDALERRVAAGFGECRAHSVNVAWLSAFSTLGRLIVT